MGAIRVHEFISLDGVIDTPSWTFGFGFDPKMGEAIGRVTADSDGILLGRKTYEMFEPAWSKRTAEQERGAGVVGGPAGPVTADRAALCGRPGRRPSSISPSSRPRATVGRAGPRPLPGAGRSPAVGMLRGPFGT